MTRRTKVLVAAMVSIATMALTLGVVSAGDVHVPCEIDQRRDGQRALVTAAHDVNELPQPRQCFRIQCWKMPGHFETLRSLV